MIIYEVYIQMTGYSLNCSAPLQIIPEGLNEAVSELFNRVQDLLWTKLKDQGDFRKIDFLKISLESTGVRFDADNAFSIHYSYADRMNEHSLVTKLDDFIQAFSVASKR